MAVLPAPERIAAHTAEDDGGPVVMLNLLRVAGGDRGLYEEYSQRVLPILCQDRSRGRLRLEIADPRGRGLEDSLLQATRELHAEGAGGG